MLVRWQGDQGGDSRHAIRGDRGKVPSWLSTDQGQPCLLLCPTPEEANEVWGLRNNAANWNYIGLRLWSQDKNRETVIAKIQMRGNGGLGHFYQLLPKSKGKILFLFIYLIYFFETKSHAIQAGVELDMQLRMTLNFSCF